MARSDRVTASDDETPDKIAISLTGQTRDWMLQMRENYPNLSDKQIIDHLKRSASAPWDVFISQVTSLDQAARTAMTKDEYVLWKWMLAVVRQCHAGILDAGAVHDHLDGQLDPLRGEDTS